MTRRELEKRLRSRLEQPLPGVEGQMLLSPRPRRGWRPGHLPDDCREGAGLLLLYPHDSRIHLVLTLRDDELPQHAGQVSLAGGAVEPGESRTEAALREAREEIGIDPARIRILGELTALHIPASSFVLHPLVAIADERPDLRPEAGEVARILEVPLSRLTDPRRLVVEQRHHRGQAYQVPYFDVDGEKVWGATAMILAEFLCLLDYRPNPWAKP